MAYKSCRRSDFEAFVSKHENRLYRTALAITGNISDAEDIVQEGKLRSLILSHTPCRFSA